MPSAKPRSESAPVETALKLSPVEAPQLPIAAMMRPATSSAWTWWTVSRPKFGSASLSPRARAENTAGLKLPAGLSGAQPGPTMCPGWTIVAGNPVARACRSRKASASALRIP